MAFNEADLNLIKQVGAPVRTCVVINTQNLERLFFIGSKDDYDNNRDYPLSSDGRLIPQRLIAYWHKDPEYSRKTDFWVLHFWEDGTGDNTSKENLDGTTSPNRGRLWCVRAN